MKVDFLPGIAVPVMDARGPQPGAQFLVRLAEACGAKSRPGGVAELAAPDASPAAECDATSAESEPGAVQVTERPVLGDGHAVKPCRATPLGGQAAHSQVQAVCCAPMSGGPAAPEGLAQKPKAVPVDHRHVVPQEETSWPQHEKSLRPAGRRRPNPALSPPDAPQVGVVPASLPAGATILPDIHVSAPENASGGRDRSEIPDLRGGARTGEVAAQPSVDARSPSSAGEAALGRTGASAEDDGEREIVSSQAGLPYAIIPESKSTERAASPLPQVTAAATARIAATAVIAPADAPRGAPHGPALAVSSPPSPAAMGGSSPGERPVATRVTERRRETPRQDGIAESNFRQPGMGSPHKQAIAAADHEPAPDLRTAEPKPLEVPSAAAPVTFEAIQGSADAIAIDMRGQPALPSAVSQSPGPAASPEPGRGGTSVAEQVAPALIALGRSGDTRHLTIQLHPAELGAVRIRVEQLREGGARVTLTAERPATLDLLVHGQGHLHAALDQAGVPAERTVSFHLAPADPGAAPQAGSRGTDSSGAGWSNGGQGRTQQRTGGASGPVSDGVAGADEPPLAPFRWQRAGIDIMA